MNSLTESEFYLQKHPHLIRLRPTRVLFLTPLPETEGENWVVLFNLAQKGLLSLQVLEAFCPYVELHFNKGPRDRLWRVVHSESAFQFNLRTWLFRFLIFVFLLGLGQLSQPLPPPKLNSWLGEGPGGTGGGGDTLGYTQWSSDCL